jgi:hypothetical protein
MPSREERTNAVFTGGPQTQELGFMTELGVARWTHVKKNKWVLRVDNHGLLIDLGPILFDWYGHLMPNGARDYSFDWQESWPCLADTKLSSPYPNRRFPTRADMRFFTQTNTD